MKDIFKVGPDDMWAGADDWVKTGESRYLEGRVNPDRLADESLVACWDGVSDRDIPSDLQRRLGALRLRYGASNHDYEQVGKLRMTSHSSEDQ